MRVAIRNPMRKPTRNWFEYLRVAAQLTYEELGEFRQPYADGDDQEQVPEVLH